MSKIRIDWTGDCLQGILLGLLSFFTLRIVTDIDKRQHSKEEQWISKDGSRISDLPTSTAKGEYLVVAAIALCLVIVSFVSGHEFWPGDNYYKSIGSDLADIGCPLHAEEAYRISLTLNPKNGDAHVGLASVLLQEGRQPEAISEAKQAQQDGITDNDVYEKLGMKKN